MNNQSLFFLGGGREREGEEDLRANTNHHKTTKSNKWTIKGGISICTHITKTNKWTPTKEANVCQKNYHSVLVLTLKYNKDTFKIVFMCITYACKLFQCLNVCLCHSLFLSQWKENDDCTFTKMCLLTSDHCNLACITLNQDTCLAHTWHIPPI